MLTVFFCACLILRDITHVLRTSRNRQLARLFHLLTGDTGREAIIKALNGPGEVFNRTSAFRTLITQWRPDTIQ
jgi:hypothetical protein